MLAASRSLALLVLAASFPAVAGVHEDRLRAAVEKYGSVACWCDNEEKLEFKLSSIPLMNDYQLVQIVDGWAIYQSSVMERLSVSHPNILAVRLSSIRGDIARGQRLVVHARYLGSLGEAAFEDRHGFPVRVRRYEAVYP